MIKKDFVKSMSKKSGLSKDVCIAVLNSMPCVIGEALADGDEVRIRNFGAFVNKNFIAAKYYSPLTNKIHEVPARRIPVFKYSAKLKKTINND